MTETAPLETHRLQISEDAAIVLDWTPPAITPARSAVFIHGLASNRQGEKATAFREGFASRGWGFLSVDLRGHGDAGGSIQDLTLSQCLEDMAAALDWLVERGGGEKPVLIGSSMGGAVAAWRHLAHPRETGPLVLIAPSLQFPGRMAWQLGPAAMEEWKTTGLRRFESDWIDLEIGFGLIDDGINYDPQKLLRGHAAPTLIFHGMKDDAVPWRTSSTFQEDCPYPQIDLVLLKDGDHRLSEHKEFLFDTMWAWLQGR